MPTFPTQRGNIHLSQLRQGSAAEKGLMLYDANGDLLPLDFPNDSTKFLNGNGVFADPAGGGGAGGLFGLLPFTYALPSSSSFTTVCTNPSRFTVADDPSGPYGVLMQRNANTPSGDDWYLMVESIPTAPYTLVLGVQFVNMVADNYTYGGAILRNSSSGKFVAWYIGMLSANMHFAGSQWNNPTSFNSQDSLISLSPNLVPGAHNYFLQIQDDNTNRIYSWSTDGINFQELRRTSRTTFITPDQIGFGMGANFAAPTHTIPIIMRVTHFKITQP